MTKRIAVVGACPYPVPQGSQVLITETARCLQEAGNEVHLVVYGYGAGEDPDGLTIHRSANVFSAKRTNAGPSVQKPFLDLALLRTLRQVIREHDIEAVHAHNYEGLAVALASGHRRVVYHAHNLMADELPHYFGGATWASKFGRTLDRNLPRRAHAVVALHERQAEALAEAGVKQSKIHIVPPSVDLDAFKVTRTYNEEPSILYTGNLDAYQNLQYMNGVHARVKDLHWVIATNDTRPLPFGRRVATPTLDSLVEVLATDAIMVCPRVSWSGYPMKILNGMAAGLPVVAMESAAGPIEDGVTGLTISPNDPEKFAAAILRLANDQELRKSIGSAARAYVERHHSRAAIAERLMATWTE